MRLEDKLNEAVKRYEELSAALSQPEINNDPEKLRRFLSDQNALEPLIETYRTYLRAKEDEKGALALLSDPGEAEMYALAQEELKSAKENEERLEKELTLLLLPRDPDDKRNVIMEIRAAAGGEESALFAAELYRMYSMYLAKQGWKTEPLSRSETGLGGLKEISFTVKGTDVYGRLKYESGVHRVQRVPVTDSQGKLQTSTATVAVLPEAEDVSVEIRESDLKIDTMKSSGAGGQHINKTESAIRITHLPTGLVVECRDERSQLQNKEKAMRVLRTRLWQRSREEADEKRSSERKTLIGTGDRSEKIRTYHYPQNRITDHRIGYTAYNLDRVLDGDLGALLDALAVAETAEKLKSSDEGNS